MKPKIIATIFDKKGRVLSVGHNSYTKTHPLQYYYSKKCKNIEKVFIHAEIAALVKVRFGIPYKIKIERYGFDGRELLAAPCPGCLLAIQEAGIKVIEFTLGS